MIPTRLKIHNFMCYREVPPFSFAGIHTACICGDNGSGKSALIDAITWALWGKTRAKSDDELIYLGEAETEVVFDFTVEGQLYRIIRKHARPKRHGASGQSSLDLYLVSDDGFKVISGDSKSQTQQKITDILHMDYDTFINSAFLRQGHAGQFTEQPPAKRKEVLANILGLDFYDQLEEQAREQAKQQAVETEQLESAIEDIDNELNQEATFEAELEKAQEELGRIERLTAEQQTRRDRLLEEKQSLENKKRQLARLDDLISKSQQDLKRWHDQHQQSLLMIKEFEELIAQRPVIEEGYRQFALTKKLYDELNQKLVLLRKLDAGKSQLEKAIDRAQAALITKHTVSLNKITELEATAQKLDSLRKELQELQSQWHRLAQTEAELEKKRQAGRDEQAQLTRLETDQGRLKQEIRDVEEKLGRLSGQSGARCPLCETQLGNEGLKLVKAKYTAEKEQKSEAIGLNEAEISAQKKALQSVENELLILETKLNQDKNSLQGRDSILRQAIAQAEEASSRLGEESKMLAVLEEKLAGKDFALTEQATLVKLGAEIAGLDYDSQRHQQAKQQLSSLEQYDNRQRRLEEAERRLDREKETATQAGQAVQELNQRLEVDRKERQDLKLELEALPQVDQELSQAETEFRRLTEEQRQAQQLIGSLKERLKRCKELKDQKEEKEKHLGRAREMETVYKELAQAFGKKGIQAMLIETALPEIEAEANRLLGRMTDNRMHVKIESQRPSKKGAVIETLDIKIADELGTRSYEMFSGGEAFRIDFAIRIALSKLLAKRAGAPLPTLIVDEGFGTQDIAGIERLKEAINSIQDDFDKILVITHIEDLKDAFPVRIEVNKTAQGSTLQVS